jgi:hypothetical protein
MLSPPKKEVFIKELYIFYYIKANKKEIFLSLYIMQLMLQQFQGILLLQ